jgi:D-3-phosphoglycerate dehydrogenase
MTCGETVRFKVAVTDFTFPDFSRYRDELGTDVDLIVPNRPGADRFVEIAHDADALLHEHLTLSAAVIDRLDRCRVIAHHGKGVDNIALDAASARGIVVANVLDASLHEVAEHVFALAFALARRLTAYDDAVRAGRWDVRVGVPVHRLHGKTLGLVGFGRIAQIVAIRALAFGMSVVTYARHPDAELARRLGVSFADLDTVFAQADVVSVHLPLTAQTERIVSAALLRRMKRTAIFINVSRGGLVDEAALCEALATDRLSGAGLDVLADEPPRDDNRLLRLENVVVTPHCAWYSEEGRDDVERRTAREAARVLAGRAPLSWVNPEALPRFVERWGELQQS